MGNSASYKPVVQEKKKKGPKVIAQTFEIHKSDEQTRLEPIFELEELQTSVRLPSLVNNTELPSECSMCLVSPQIVQTVDSHFEKDSQQTEARSPGFVVSVETCLETSLNPAAIKTSARTMPVRTTRKTQRKSHRKNKGIPAKRLSDEQFLEVERKLRHSTKKTSVNRYYRQAAQI